MIDLSTCLLLKAKGAIRQVFVKDSFNNYVDKMRVGRGSKKSVCFCPSSGMNTVHAGGGGKNGNILST